jgi:hypothetical protein
MDWLVRWLPFVAPVPILVLGVGLMTAREALYARVCFVIAALLAAVPICAWFQQTEQFELPNLLIAAGALTVFGFCLAALLRVVDRKVAASRPAFTIVDVRFWDDGSKDFAVNASLVNGADRLRVTNWRLEVVRAQKPVLKIPEPSRVLARMNELTHGALDSYETRVGLVCFPFLDSVLPDSDALKDADVTLFVTPSGQKPLRASYRIR